MVNQAKTIKVYDNGQIFSVATFDNLSNAAIVPGFVEIVSGSDWVVKQATTSSTKRPLGIVTESVSSGSEAFEVAQTGYFRMTAGEDLVAGNPVFPKTGGLIMKTGAASSDAKGYGTVVVGATSGNVAIITLQGLL